LLGTARAAPPLPPPVGVPAQTPAPTPAGAPSPTAAAPEGPERTAAAPEGPERRGRRRARRPRVAVALDEAFNFYYPEALELLEAQGAEVIPFSPLRDEALPRGTGLLLLGGGFPERHAARLAANTAMLRAIRRFHAAGGAVYAECGGLMLLAREIDGRTMAGLLPARVRMTGRLAGFGYRELELARDSLLGPAGLRLRGHEFHYSALVDPLPEEAAAYRMWRPGADGPAAARPEGYARDHLFASYVHIHLAGHPEVAGRLVEAAAGGPGER
ncbi:MAG: cobyrinic acid a,c-diamide synthase, partial [Clostridia bacterium]|nr:cobyrinic acid a,c-diamide synthase [Clostridia bacterium]